METKNKVAIFDNGNGGVAVMNFAHNVYVPIGKEKLERADFVTIDGDISHLLEDVTIPAVPEQLGEKMIDGVLTVVVVKAAEPAYIIHAAYRHATIEELCARDIPAGIDYQVVGQDQIPTDRYFRNAWKSEGKNIAVDMEKAREIHKGILREERAKIFPDLDVKYIRADEAGNAEEKAAIVQRKQELRDITKHPELEAATTPEELKLAAISLITKKE